MPPIPRARAAGPFLTVAALFLSACATEPRVATAVIESSPSDPPSTPAGPRLGPDSRNYDQEHLALAIDLDMQGGTLTGTATHTMTALADLSQVRLHLSDMTVTSVTSDGGAPCTSTAAGGILTIGLDRARTKGERFTLSISYGGAPK